MGAVQKIVSIGMDKALTLSRPKINAPAKSPSSRPAFISPAAIRSSVKTGVCRSLGSGMDACSRKMVRRISCSIRSFIRSPPAVYLRVYFWRYEAVI